MKTSSCYRCLSRDAIKALAMLTMFLNHFAHMFVPPGALHDALTYIGYFTAPVMCYFLVEGFDKTKDRKAYFLRLITMAFASQVFYDGALGIGNLNMMFTLATCFCIILCLEKVRPWPLRSLGVFFLLLASCMMDWMILAPVFVIQIWIVRRHNFRCRMLCAYLSCYAFYVWTAGPRGLYGMGLVTALVSGLGILAAGFAIEFLYNGRRADASAKTRKCLQAFFYVFYPAHLAVLWLAAELLRAGA